MTATPSFPTLRELPGVAASAFRGNDGILQVELYSEVFTKEQGHQLALKAMRVSGKLVHAGAKATLFSWQFDSAHVVCALGPEPVAVVLLGDKRKDQYPAREGAILQALGMIGLNDDPTG